MSLRCKLFGHKWKQVFIGVIECERCGKVDYISGILAHVEKIIAKHKETKGFWE